VEQVAPVGPVEQIVRPVAVAIDALLVGRRRAHRRAVRIALVEDLPQGAVDLRRSREDERGARPVEPGLDRRRARLRRVERLGRQVLVAGDLALRPRHHEERGAEQAQDERHEQRDDESRSPLTAHSWSKK
jgi:hypothetical protein